MFRHLYIPTPYTEGLFIFENKKKVSCHATKLVVTIQIHFVHREEERGDLLHICHVLVTNGPCVFGPNLDFV